VEGDEGEKGNRMNEKRTKRNVRKDKMKMGRKASRRGRDIGTGKVGALVQVVLHAIPCVPSEET